MAVDEAPVGVEEVHILWISEGMSCDGDSVSVTAAGQPGIEDVLLGAIPGIPKVHLHNKVLSPTLGGEEFLKPFRAAARGELDAPFVFVMEGSIPNEKINGDGYWSSFGNDEATGEPLTVPTTWAGTSARPAACRSSTSPAARCSPRTSWRRWSGCSTRPRAWRR
jgi:Ni,Fe-hydrogenase I small subunit